MKYASIIKTFGIGHNDCHHHFNFCASGPPAKLLERHDHAALARWYEQEAATLRQRAEELRTMAREVRDYDSQGFYVDKLTLMKHCGDFADDYSKAADKAEKLAQIHSGRHAAQ